jgi:hypothetical protein
VIGWKGKPKSKQRRSPRGPFKIKPESRSPYYEIPKAVNHVKMIKKKYKRGASLILGTVSRPE